MKKIACFLVVVLSLAGCGYTNKTVLPNNIKTIYVETIKNKIPIENIYAYVPGLEMTITNDIVRKLERDGNLKVVSREEADAILDASLIGFEQEGVRFNSLERVQEFRMFLVLSMKLIDKSGKIIWQEPNFSGDSEYFISDVRSTAREEAANRAAERLAKNVVDRIVEDW